MKKNRQSNMLYGLGFFIVLGGVIAVFGINYLSDLSDSNKILQDNNTHTSHHGPTVKKTARGPDPGPELALELEPEAIPEPEPLVGLDQEAELVAKPDDKSTIENEENEGDILQQAKAVYEESMRTLDLLFD